MRKALAVLVGLCLTLAIAEAGLRSLADDHYYVWKPGVSTLSHVLPGVMPGIEGEAVFAIGAHGLRGEPFDDGQRFRILALGGSTTECLFLDTEEAWTHLLQERLSLATDERVWVGSAGKSGHTARHHVLQTRYLLAQYPPIDVVLVLVGVNDFHQFLAFDGGWRPRAPFDRLGEHRRLADLRLAFAHLPRRHRAQETFLRRTELWHVLRRARRALAPVVGVRASHELDAGGEIYAHWRANRRANTGIRRELPHLGLVLREYRRNLRHVIVEARERGARPVLVTQPTMWREDLPQDLCELMLFGGVGDYFGEPGKEYYSIEALAQGMAVFNDNLVSVCAALGADCIDLAAALPKDDTIFFDDCHFNENGAREVARVVAAYFLERGLLQGVEARRASGGSGLAMR